MNWSVHISAPCSEDKYRFMLTKLAGSKLHAKHDLYEIYYQKSMDINITIVLVIHSKNCSPGSSVLAYTLVPPPEIRER
jgi:hypothetical protein